MLSKAGCRDVPASHPTRRGGVPRSVVHCTLADCADVVSSSSCNVVLSNFCLNSQFMKVGWIICGLFTLVAVVASGWLIYKHLKWYTVVSLREFEPVFLAHRFHRRDSSAVSDLDVLRGKGTKTIPKISYVAFSSFRSTP